LGSFELENKYSIHVTEISGKLIKISGKKGGGGGIKNVQSFQCRPLDN
jgi:hypothetical protein